MPSVTPSGRRPFLFEQGIGSPSVFRRSRPLSIYLKGLGLPDGIRSGPQGNYDLTADLRRYALNRVQMPMETNPTPAM
jgi:hypothetical protein